MRLYKDVCLSVRGAGHIQLDMPCQDFAASVVMENRAVAAVADGHGSKKHFRSNIGARLAVEAAIDVIKSYICDKDFDKLLEIRTEKTICKLKKAIITEWNVRIKSYHLQNEYSEKELEYINNENIVVDRWEAVYGTTLIVCMLTERYYFILQIGDGNAVVIHSDLIADMPVPKDDRLAGNFTTSLCDSNAIDSFRHKIAFENANGVLLSTDGLYNSFASEEAFINYNKLIYNYDGDKTVLNNNLEANFLKRSEEGSRDDISLAAVMLSNNAKQDLS